MSDLKSYFRCYICNISDIPGREGTKILRQELLDSGLHLIEAVEQLLGHSIDPSTDATICTKCYKTCEEYDEINKRLINIKSKLRNTSANSLLNRAVVVKYETTDQEAVEANEHFISQTDTAATGPKIKASGKIIVSASKLKPVPSDFVLGGTLSSAVSKDRLPSRTAPTPLKLFERSKASTSTLNPSSLLIRNQHVEPVLPSPYAPIGKIKMPSRMPASRNSCPLTLKRARVAAVPAVFTEHVSGEGYVKLEPKSVPESEDYIISEVEVLGSDHVQDGQAETLLVDENGQVLEMMEAGTTLLSDVNEINLVLPKSGATNDSAVEQIAEHDEQIAEHDEQMSAYTLSNTDSEVRKIVSMKDNVYTCLVCASSEEEEFAEFDKPSLIMIHMKEAHSLRLYVCTECGSCYRKRASYEQCVQSHHDFEVAKKATGTAHRRRYNCDSCERSFVSKTLIEQHMNVHTGSRPFKCKLCDKCYTNKYILHSHLKTHSERPRPFKCEECGKGFMTLSNLHQHEKTHDPMKLAFPCKECGKSFASAHSRETHATVHSSEKPFVCGVCEKPFARRAEVRDHLRTHTGEKPFECDVCGARFAQSSNMNTHKRAVHYDERRYECEQCSKKFRRRRLLKYHVQSAHTGERPHRCHICDASFVYPEHMKKHVRAIHDPKSKTFACEVCNKKFNSRDNRNVHRYTHSDKKPYECFVCGAGFMRKAPLYGHMSNEGHLADMIVVNQARLAVHSVKDKEVIMDTNESEAADVPAEMEQTEDESGVDTDQNIYITGTMEGSDLEQFLNAGSEVLTTDEDGNVMRLVQVRLQNGRLAWATVPAT